ncbi:nondiscriminating glutamyl-tRNA synthetase EARS2, mitochondrial-like [Glandiceps talaboti]
MLFTLKVCRIHRCIKLSRLFESTISRCKYGTIGVTNNVRVRFAPSPTGRIHLGGLRTALYNYLFAKSHGGKFLLRIEDTDQSRLVPDAMENIEDTLNWANLIPDEGPSQGGDCGPYVQSERLPIYKEHADILLKKGKAYYCFCSQQRLRLIRKEAVRKKETPKYDNRCRHLTPQQIQDKLDQGHSHVTRFKLDDGAETFEDLVYGVVQQRPALVEGDPVIIKADGFPVYHFANVVDDHCMQISHVLRGWEWLTSVGKHIQLYNAFGWTPPQFAHLPLLLNKDGSKLSKRQNDIGVDYLQDKGHSSENILNLITFCGAGFEDNRKIRTLSQMVDEFLLERVTQHSAILDMEMLDYISQQDMLNTSQVTEGMQKLVTKLRQLVINTYQERIQDSIQLNNDKHLHNIIEIRKLHIKSLNDLVSDKYTYLWIAPDTSREIVKGILPQPDTFLQHFVKLFTEVPEGEWKQENLAKLLKSLRKRKDFDFPPFPKMMKVVRYSLTGQKEGPAVAEILEMLLKAEVLERITRIMKT